MTKELAKTYDPAQVEERIYRFWLDGGCFHARRDPDRRPFCIVIPPPNVTGSLHMGHAMDETLQDILTRWRRMQGYSALWLPGMDHAGIATQHVVERDLAREGLSRHGLGREAFVDRVWQWKGRYAAEIRRQLQRLGSSCDWERERFTMDEGCSRAVRRVFVALYRKGLIYRGDYIINWCPECGTALSDLEVEHESSQSKLWHIRYPLAEGEGGLIVATTRPETMLGDTAVAVSPDDPRYRDLIGKECILPLVGRRLPIIADAAVDPEFGTGAVKVTPAHDPADFDMGLRHKLETINVIGKDGRMTGAAGGRYAGQDRLECREAVLADLEAGGHLARTEDYEHSVGRCYRCDSVIEPLVSRQWFVRMEPLAAPAIAAVEEGRVQFVPQRFTRVYLNWLENIRDWCISRQIWWGHRIPAWYCAACGEVTVAVDDPTACEHCGAADLEQEEDVLDTWFSSALWPFSTLGWPEDTEDLKYFFPTSVLVTGYDIIFFWVARMVFMSLEFTGQPPFDHVLIHGLVRDAQGRKMSKSKGTGIDPLKAVDEYGADTLRFTLVTGVAPGNDTRYRPERVEAGRNFCNKLWNASRFVLMNLEGYEPDGWIPGEQADGGPLEPADRWILHRLAAVEDRVTDLLEGFDSGEAARVLYDFTWSEFCDWYIELTKARLYGEDAAARRTAQRMLIFVLERLLRLLHPFMPFITEEIWQSLPGTEGACVIAPWPAGDRPGDMRDEAAAAAMETVMDVIRAARNLRSEAGVPPQRPARLVVRTDERTAAVLRDAAGYIEALAQADPLEIGPPAGAKPRQALAAVVGGTEVYLPLEGLVDIEAEVARLQKALKTAAAEAERSSGKLADPNFREKAPAEVVQKEEARLEEHRREIAGLRQRLEQLRQ